MEVVETVSQDRFERVDDPIVDVTVSLILKENVVQIVDVPVPQDVSQVAQRTIDQIVDVPCRRMCRRWCNAPWSRWST